MSQAEKTFQARAEEVVQKLERMAQAVRCLASCDYSATERTGDMIHAIHWGVSNMSFETLIKRAVLADEERAK